MIKSRERCVLSQIHHPSRHSTLSLLCFRTQPKRVKSANFIIQNTTEQQQQNCEIQNRTTLMQYCTAVPPQHTLTRRQHGICAAATSTKIYTDTPLVRHPHLALSTVVLDMIQYSLSIIYDNRRPIPMHGQPKVATPYCIRKISRCDDLATEIHGDLNRNNDGSSSGSHDTPLLHPRLSSTV
jgi:hypothetical protein